MAIPPIAPLGPLTGAGAAAGNGAAVRAGSAGDASAVGQGFTSALEQAIGNLNGLQAQADEASQGLASGQIKDVAQAVIAAEKASLGLQLAVQVRNKAIAAYQQIMQMQM